jgi:UDP-glucose 4-epimerase
MTDPTLTASAITDADHIFCFAGGVGAVRSLDEPLLDLDTSARAQVILLDAIRAIAPRASVVLAGSRLEYGVPRYLPMDERHPLQPTSPYAANKVLCTWYYEHYARAYGLHTVVLRLPNPYGRHVEGSPARSGYSILNLFIDRARRGEPITLYGDGSQLRDFVHVDDVASAALRASTESMAAGRVFNIGSGRATSLREVAEIIVDLCGSGSVLTGESWPEGAAAVETGSYTFDIRLAEELLGWRPSVDLRDGLERLLRD